MLVRFYKSLTRVEKFCALLVILVVVYKIAEPCARAVWLVTFFQDNAAEIASAEFSTGGLKSEDAGIEAVSTLEKFNETEKAVVLLSTLLETGIANRDRTKIRSAYRLLRDVDKKHVMSKVSWQKFCKPFQDHLDNLFAHDLVTLPKVDREEIYWIPDAAPALASTYEQHGLISESEDLLKRELDWVTRDRKILSGQYALHAQPLLRFYQRQGNKAGVRGIKNHIAKMQKTELQNLRTATR